MRIIAAIEPIPEDASGGTHSQVRETAVEAESYEAGAAELRA